MARQWHWTDQRANAFLLLDQGGVTLEQAALAVGVSLPTIRGWVRRPAWRELRAARLPQLRAKLALRDMQRAAEAEHQYDQLRQAAAHALAADEPLLTSGAPWTDLAAAFPDLDLSEALDMLLANLSGSVLNDEP